MKMNMRFHALSSCFALILLGSPCFADTIGQDDFDSNRTSLTYTTTPVDLGLNGLFGATATRFDRWGIANRTVGDAVPNVAPLLGLPFDLVDETVTPHPNDDDGLPFTNDDAGIISGTKTDNFFVIADLENGLNNSGTGTVTWTFDITGYENIQVSLDWAGQGSFSGNDSLTLQATIDAGTPQTLMTGVDNPGVQYTITMDSGLVNDRAASPFWDAADDAIHNLLVTNGPFQNGNDFIEYCDCDVNQDGFDDLSLEKTYQEQTTFNGGPATFVQAEAFLYIDPFSINGTDLDDDFQTISAPVTGTGSVLTLTLDVAQNGSLEFIVFDDLLVTGDLPSSAVEGDYDGDGSVGQGDLDIVLLNWGGASFPGDENAIPGGGPFDGGVDQNELDGVLLNWGNTSLAAAGVVPEPSTMMMCGLGLALVAGLRRKAA